MTQENVAPEKPPKKKKKHIVGKIILLVIVLVIGVGALMFFKVPQNIGLIKSPAEKMFATTPDRAKAATIMTNLQQAGLNTNGVEVYVMPVAGTDHNVAMVVLDASKGFDIGASKSADPVKDFLKVVSAAQADGVNRAAVVYYNENGKALVTATVPTADALAFSQGKITSQQLMKKVDVGANDVAGFISEITKQLK
jgi:uncharacterized protein (UPF0333 family)